MEPAAALERLGEWISPVRVGIERLRRKRGPASGGSRISGGGAALPELLRGVRDEEILRISEAEIRRVAHRHGVPGSLPIIVVRQAMTEVWVRLGRGIPFRNRVNAYARVHYSAMNPTEFHGVNARQWWANWRTIPRSLSGRVLNRPYRVLDLCCGTGGSTEVLAHYLPSGSDILGLEYSPEFAELARRRDYRHADGSAARAAFRVQSVLETFRGLDELPIPADSLDLVNCSGAICCAFEAAAVARLAPEVYRVVRPGGLALMDSGPGGTPKQKVMELFTAQGFRVLNAAKSCLLDPNSHICLEKPAGARG
ncbi:MAG: class I SAM-dependent methyltransferase [Planctomycetes bacterium]|nr:class I SAM-dependent methyltransferase [Planctomycetota bacterium]